MTTPAEVWLRGPVDGIIPVLQPAAHAILQVGEDVLPIVADLTLEQLWTRHGGAAALGFHLLHLPGSLDRLLTYSRGAALTPAQFNSLAAERTAHESRPELPGLLDRFAAGIDAAVAYLRTVPEASLLIPREVGRRRLPLDHPRAHLPCGGAFVSPCRPNCDLEPAGST
jgi:hypothetical protein